MKKFFTLCFSLLMGCAALNAQVIGGNVDETVQFVNGEGETIANGESYIANIVEIEEIVPGYLSGMVETDAVLKNMSESAAGVYLNAKVLSTDNGAFQLCTQGNCIQLTTGVATTYPNFLLIQSGVELPLGLELVIDNVDAPATGEIELQIVRHNIVMDNYGQPAAGDESYPGSKITLKFTTDETAGITDATVAKSNEVVARYTLDGRAIDAPQKGVNIVKYADGRTVKVVVK